MATRTRIFSFVFVMMMMMSFTVLWGHCSPKIYKVGDSEGWTDKDDVYYAWAEAGYKEYHVGDSLVSEYDPNMNDVTHVSGLLVVRLTEPGVQYFITSRSGYCEAGLKLRVMVGPQPKAVTYPNFPKKVDLLAVESLNNWLKTFKHQPRH